MVYLESTWNGFKRLDFILNGRQAILIVPDKAVEGKKWLLKTEYFDAFPNFEIEMVRRGYHLAYIKNESGWHKPKDSEAKAKLADFLHEEFGLHEKCMPVGMSCGGLQAMYFTGHYPEKVAALYLDAPVINLLSCPCAVGRDVSLKQVSFDRMYQGMIAAHGMMVHDMLNYRNHPYDHAPAIIKHNIPVILVSGDADYVVPYEENGKALKEYLLAHGGNYTEVIKPGGDHHPHGLEDPTPIVEFTEKYY